MHHNLPLLLLLVVVQLPVNAFKRSNVVRLRPSDEQGFVQDGI